MKRLIYIKRYIDGTKNIDLFPLRHSLKNYSFEKLFDDAKSGMSVSFLSFSMGMAYSMIAGLPVQYGLFGGIVAALISSIFSSSRYIMFGPSNASAIILLSAFASMGLTTPEERITGAAAIVFLVGVFLALGSIFKVTNLVRYVSRTVITGHITASAIQIISNQISGSLGFSFPEGTATNSLPSTIYAIYESMDLFQIDAIAISLASIILIFIFRKFLKFLPAEAMALITVSFAVYLIGIFYDFSSVNFLNPVAISDWKLTAPSFELFSVRDAMFAAFAVALLCSLEATAIGKTMATKNADILNTNQELFSLGVANIACGASGGTVESGSLTRSALTMNTGARTPIVNLFSGLFMLLGIFVLGSLIGFIPKPALATVVIITGFSLFNKRAIRIALGSTKSDALVFLVAFFVGLLFSLEDAIYVGVALSIMLFLGKAGTPEVVEVAIDDKGGIKLVGEKSERSIPSVSIVHIEGNLFFGASDLFQMQLKKICKDKDLKVLILKLRNAMNLDATSASDLAEIAKQMNSRGGKLYLCEIMPDTMRVLKGSGVAKEIGEENMFEFTFSNPTLSAAKAIKSARAFLDNKDFSVEIIV